MVHTVIWKNENWISPTSDWFCLITPQINKSMGIWTSWKPEFRQLLEKLTSLMYFRSHQCIKGELHLRSKLSIFCALSQNYQHCLENNLGILKQIIWKTQKWHCNFSTPSSSWVIDQNNILHVWSITQEQRGLVKFQCHIGVSQTICLRMLTLFFLKYRYFWVFNFGLGCSFPLGRIKYTLQQHIGWFIPLK